MNTAITDLDKDNHDYVIKISNLDHNFVIVSD